MVFCPREMMLISPGVSWENDLHMVGGPYLCYYHLKQKVNVMCIVLCLLQIGDLEKIDFMNIHKPAGNSGFSGGSIEQV